MKSFADKGMIDLYHFDESGFSLDPNVPYAWSLVGETLRVPAKRSKQLNVLGFLNTRTPGLFASTTYDKVDTDVVIAVFDLFVQQLKKKTVVVLDNASMHTSSKFKAKSEEWEKQGLTLFYLPPYSPQLNPIEMLWKYMKYYWIEFDAYVSIEAMRAYVEKVIIGYGKDYEISFG